MTVIIGVVAIVGAVAFGVYLWWADR